MSVPALPNEYVIVPAEVLVDVLLAARAAMAVLIKEDLIPRNTWVEMQTADSIEVVRRLIDEQAPFNSIILMEAEAKHKEPS